MTSPAEVQVSGHESPRDGTKDHPSTEPTETGTEVAPEWYRPSRGYKWAPFQPGHKLSTKHGAYSRIVEAEARALIEEALDGASWLEPIDRPVLELWAISTIRCQRLRIWLDANAAPNTPPELGADGEVKGAAALLLREETKAANLASRLGFDPLSRAKLQRDTAAAAVGVADVASMLEAGRIAREAAEQRAADASVHEQREQADELSNTDPDPDQDQEDNTQ